MIKAVIIDDEEKSRRTLQRLLEKHVPSVQVCNLCDSVESAVKTIDQHKPGLIFLDIEMPFKNGFELLEKYKKPEFDVIFVTAYNDYAIQAIRANALDYLLKPIDVDELVKAVQKVEERTQKNSGFKNFESLLNNLKGGAAKISIPTFDGLQMINAEDIIKCVADESYTHVYLNGGKKVTVSKLLKEFEELLNPYNFLRIHNSCLVNLIHVTRYIKGEGGYVIMSDGENCEVSRRRKNELIQRLSLVKL